MGCNYKIYGSIMLRRSQDVEALLEALREQLDDSAVEVEELDANTIDLRALLRRFHPCSYSGGNGRAVQANEALRHQCG